MGGTGSGVAAWAGAQNHLTLWDSIASEKSQAHRKTHFAILESDPRHPGQ
jgi:hypothetical protein